MTPWIRTAARLGALVSLAACGDGRRLGGKYDSAPAAAAGTPSSTAGTGGQGGSPSVPSGGSPGHSGGSSSSMGSGGSAGTPEPPQCDGVTSFGAESFTFERPWSVAIGDLDRNGQNDIVVGTMAGIEVLSARNGSFERSTLISTGPSNWRVSLGDLNGDDQLDLFASDGPSLKVLLGNGDGTFLEAQEHPVSTSLRVVVSGDLNGDAKLDLAGLGTNDESERTIDVLLGNGDGTLQPAVKSALREAGSWVASGAFLTLGDVNGDSHLDFAVAEQTGVALYDERVSLLLGNGDGTFQPALELVTFGEIAEIALADLDADDRLDLVVASVEDEQGAVNVMLGNGDGTFQTPRSFSAGMKDAGARCLKAADMNDDGKPDVVVTDNRARGYFSDANVLLGNGDGTLQSFQPFLVGSIPHAVAIGDLNGDHTLDIAAVNFLSDNVSVLHGNGDGSLRGGRNVLIQTETYIRSGYSYSLGVADFNADHAPDLIAGSYGDDSANVLLARDDGTFENARAYVAEDAAGSTLLGDLNADGHVDFVTGAFHDGPRSVLGNGDGSFATAREIAGTSGFISAVIDLNGDDRLDLVGSCEVMLGNGDGSFQPAIALPIANCSIVASGELNGDGRPDLIESDDQSEFLKVLLANGDGTFQAPQELDVASDVPATTIADLDHDGFGDLIVSSPDAASVEVLRGNGDGTFQNPRSYAAGGKAAHLATGDLDLDGKLDLAIALGGWLGGPEHASVLFGNGDGSFEARRDFATSVWPEHVAIGDMDGDGQPDLVVQTLNDVINVLYGRRECR